MGNCADAVRLARENASGAGQAPVAPATHTEREPGVRGHGGRGETFGWGTVGAGGRRPDAEEAGCFLLSAAPSGGIGAAIPPARRKGPGRERGDRDREGEGGGEFERLGACALPRGAAPLRTTTPGGPRAWRSDVTARRRGARGLRCTGTGRHDEAGAVAVGPGAAGLGLGRAGAGAAAAALPPGAAAAAALPARGLRLLLAGHRGLPRGHLQRLRGGGGRAAAPRRRGPRGPAPAGAAPLSSARGRGDGARGHGDGARGPGGEHLWSSCCRLREDAGN